MVLDSVAAFEQAYEVVLDHPVVGQRLGDCLLNSAESQLTVEFAMEFRMITIGLD